MDEVPNERGRKYVPLLRQCFLTGSVAVNITAQGCVIGFSAILIPSLRNPDSYIKATPSEESWIASVIGFALILGNIIITPCMDTLGRKKCHLLTILPILTGWFLFLMVNNVAGIISARFLQGISMGMLGPLGSIIIGEMTDPVNRGAYLTSVSLSLTVGVLVTHSLGTIFTWQQTAIICSVISFSSLIMIIYNPESPPWLISKGRYEEAKQIFYKLRGFGPKQEDELDTMIVSHKLTQSSAATLDGLPLKSRIKWFFRYLSETYKKPEFYKPITIMLHMYTMFQFGGINVISSYTMDIMKQVVGPDSNAEFLMVALDIERLLCSLFAMFLMKSMRRRTLLFSCGALCILTYLGKAGYVYAKQNNMLAYDNQWIPITLIVLYMFSLAVGISTIAFAISGEIFPLEYRGLGGGISVLALSLNFFVAVKCFPMLNDAIGLPLTYVLYAVIVAYCLIVIWFMLPETKGKTLQEIEDYFRGMSKDDKRVVEPLNGSRPDLMRRCSSQNIMY